MGAAVIAALYPEAVVIGSSHLQQGYLAMLLGFMLWGMSAVFVGGGRHAAAGGPPLFPITRRGGLILAFAALGLMVCISYQFGILAGAILLLAAVWMAEWRTTSGRILLGVLAGIVIALPVLHFLAEAEIIPDSLNVWLIQWKFLFGQAWTEFDRMLAAPGTDLFESLMVRMPRQIAFVVAGLYGLLQPVLPAAIGYRNVEQAGGGIWQLLGLLRAAGWYLLLPLLLYGALSSLREIVARRFVTFAGLLFWFVAAIASYRALGDQWDNPRYRLFVLAPMALVAAWGYWRWRETRSPWLARIVLPFGVACIAMTAWYIVRYWLEYRLPALWVLAAVVALSLVTFGLTFVWPHRSRRPAAETGSPPLIP